ncbi:MAG: nucleotidyl transferase AbiEii/AbiGii toxin family protein [Saprospiraceae bacterium]
MHLPVFDNYRLAGGTALGLQIGHRKSIDIDLFGVEEIEIENVIDSLNDFGKLKILSRSRNINIFSLNGIKIDLVRYKYPWISEMVLLENIRMASTVDIAAMKINGITARGSVKDFIDLYYLFKMHSLSEMVNYFQSKYHDGSIFLALKSLTYFDDAEKQELPFLFEKITWPEMKKAILLEYEKLL